MNQHGLGADRLFPLQRTRRLDRFPQMTGTAFRLRVVRQVMWRAHLGRDRARHFVVAPREHCDQAFDQRDPPVERHGAVRSERRTRRFDRAIDIVGTAQSERGDTFLGRRIDRFDRCR